MLPQPSGVFTSASEEKNGFRIQLTFAAGHGREGNPGKKSYSLHELLHVPILVTTVSIFLPVEIRSRHLNSSGNAISITVGVHSSVNNFYSRADPSLPARFARSIPMMHTPIREHCPGSSNGDSTEIAQADESAVFPRRLPHCHIEYAWLPPLHKLSREFVVSEKSGLISSVSFALSSGAAAEETATE